MLPVLIDAGPLVALIRTNDVNHERCKAISRKIIAPLITTWPVLTEATYLLRYNPDHVLILLRFIQRAELHVAEFSQQAANWFAQFFSRYSDHEPQLADVSLLYAAELLDLEDVFTIDRRDFSFYRLPDGLALNILD